MLKNLLGASITLISPILKALIIKANNKPPIIKLKITKLRGKNFIYLISSAVFILIFTSPIPKLILLYNLQIIKAYIPAIIRLAMYPNCIIKFLKFVLFFF